MAITFLFYTAKKSEAVETGCNNVLGATLFLVVYGKGNIVDNQEQCCPQNIVACMSVQQLLIFGCVK